MTTKVYNPPEEITPVDPPQTSPPINTGPSNSLGSISLGGNLRWPSTIGHDYLQIDIVEFQKTGDYQFQVTGAGSSSSPSQTESSSAVNSSGFSYSTSQLSQNTYLSNTQSKKRGKVYERIQLPVPANVGYNDSPKYNEGSGIAGKILPSLAKQMANSGEASNIAKTVQAAASAGSQGLVMSVLDKLPGLGGGAAQITQNGFGKILNPYTEQVFGGVSMRTFNFQWKLVPRNDRETDSIKNILKILRARSLPDYAARLGLKSGSGGNLDAGNISDRWLTVPKIFRLKWRNGDNNSEIDALPKIKPCVLTNVDVTYTPDNIWATYEGANPIAYDLTLGFTETEIITQSEVLGAGY